MIADIASVPTLSLKAELATFEGEECACSSSPTSCLECQYVEALLSEIDKRKDQTMTMLELSSNDIADILGGEMAIAKHEFDEYEARERMMYVRNIALSLADRCQQAKQVSPRIPTSVPYAEPFDRTKFYVRCGLRPNGELDV